MIIQFRKVTNTVSTWLAVHLPYAKNVLNIGAATGKFADIYPFEDSLITNIDKKDSEFNRFEECKRDYTTERFTNIECNCTDMSILKDNSFELVIFSEVLEHLTEEQIELTFKEIKRVLKPDGFLQLNTPNKMIRMLLGGYLANEFHIEEYTNNEVKTMLENHKFKIISNHGIFEIDKRKKVVRYLSINNPGMSYLLWFLCKNEKD